MGRVGFRIVLQQQGVVIEHFFQSGGQANDYYRDRSFAIMLFSCLTVLFMGVMLDQTQTGYNPEIIINKMTPMNLIFFCAYLVVALLPMPLQIIGEYRFKKLHKYMRSEQ
jgi:quinol-cytochrome oxidoreductase complex cytochrome b subunit